TRSRGAQGLEGAAAERTCLEPPTLAPDRTHDVEARGDGDVDVGSLLPPPPPPPPPSPTPVTGVIASAAAETLPGAADRTIRAPPQQSKSVHQPDAEGDRTSAGPRPITAAGGEPTAADPEASAATPGTLTSSAPDRQSEETRGGVPIGEPEKQPP
ncbi:unnamed protein product, partial [Scytosiphon promiscuus]